MKLRKAEPVSLGDQQFGILTTLEQNYEFSGYTLKAMVTASPKPTPTSPPAPASSFISPFSHPRLMELLDAAASIERLEALWLGNFVISQEHIKEIRKCKNLKTLVLNNDGLTDDIITHLRLMKSLRVLMLDKNSLTKVPFLIGMDGLSYLSMGDNPIKDEGFKLIMTIAPNIKFLKIVGTEITDDGLSMLIGLNKLEMIYLLRTRVTGSGLVNLLDIPAIQYVYIENERVTAQVKNMLLSKRPSIEVGLPKVPPAPRAPLLDLGEWDSIYHMM